MKLGPVTKLDKRNKTMSKKFDVTSCQNIVASLSFFGFLVNLEHFAGRIPNTESAKVMFSVTLAFCFAKTGNRTKKSLTQLSHCCFLDSFLDKKHYFFAK